MGEWTFSWGDLEAARAKASVIVSNTYSVPFAHHFAIETYAAAALPDQEGKLTIITPVQHPFILRDALADMLRRPAGDVRVKAADMGGSFGSKGYPKIEPLVAVLALKLGKPVMMRLSAEESFLTAQREAAEIKTLSGFDERGRVLFHDLEADFLVGAYTDISSRVVSKTGLHALTPYRAEAARVRARGLFTNTPPTTAFRGFGAPHTVFALESQMNMGASALGLDPLIVRLENLRDKGDAVPGDRAVDGDWRSLVERVAHEIGWSEARGEGVGKGIALGLKTCIPGTESTASVKRSPKGTITVLVGTTEMGQGTRHTLAKLVADRLGVSDNSVEVHPTDTAVSPFDALTASSRSLVHMGNAVLKACDELERAGLSSQEGVGIGTFKAPADPEHLLGGPTPFYEVVATGVEITVDRETGMVAVDRITHATDAGHVFNLRRAHGLDAGGLVMGLGLALSEQLNLDRSSGKLLNGSSLDYRIPTTWQAASLSCSLIQNGDGPGPNGAKGMAEGGILAIAPAIAQAIWECTGVYMTQLPFTPERVWSAINAVDRDWASL